MPLKPMHPARGLPTRRIQWLALAALALGCVGLDPGWLLGAFTLALVLVAALKLLEARDRRGRRLVALLQLVCCGLQAAQQPDLLPSLLQLLAAVLALAGLLQLESGQSLPLGLVLRRSLRVLGAALPMALVLFLLVPRVGPFGTSTAGPTGRASTGLSDTLDPGGIASLVDKDSPAARVAFSDDEPPPTGGRYWRVLVHSQFDGSRWQRDEDAEQTPRFPADVSAMAEVPGQPERDQVWLVEPSAFSAVPWDGAARPLSTRLHPEPEGELRLLRPALERRSYRLKELASPLGWQRQPPRRSDLQLPPTANPRLRELGRRWSQLGGPEARVLAAQAWFQSQNFRYDRNPGTLPQVNGLDAFLFERQLGFCGHYASSFSALMRAAGVPSRVVSGYLGGEWVVPMGGAPYLALRQSDAHAWSEVWLPKRGWTRVDPSVWANGTSGENLADRLSGAPTGNASTQQGWRWLQRQWWGLDMAWSRWWLGFDQSRQEALLAWLLGGQRWALGSLILGGMALGLGGALVMLRRDRQPPGDRQARAMAELLNQLRRLKIEARPGETLESLAERAGARYPALADPLQELMACHREQRFAPPATDRQAQRKLQQRWRLARRRLKSRNKGAIRQKS